MEIPMIEVRPSSGTLGGRQDHGGPGSTPTTSSSFAEYYDPKRMSWGRLRVWNG